MVDRLVDGSPAPGSSSGAPPGGPRVLYLVNGFPWPLTSGYLRHYHAIRELSARGHRITLMAIVSSDFRPEDRTALEPFTERTVTVESTRRSRSLRHRATRRLGAISIGESAARRLRDEVAEAVGEVPYDVVLFSGKRTFPALAAARGLPIVADVCDATSSRLRGNLRYASIGRFPLLVAEYLEVRWIERALLRRAVHLLFASARDRDALVDPTEWHRTTVLPNGVDLEYWRRPDEVGLGRREIVFTGGMAYPPNADAALFLIREILPRVRAEVPDAHLSIVGRDPSPKLIAAGRTPGVTVTGLVPDVRPYLTAASVYAAPLRFGAGIQNKLLEALAMGVPTVASPNGVGGLVTTEGIRPPIAVVAPKDPARFAATVVERLRAAEAEPMPRADGPAFVARHFTWARSGELLDAVLRDAAGVPGADGVRAASRPRAGSGPGPRRLGRAGRRRFP
jgi:glycosyltransferase involved in cell wall biosynthesis